MPRNDIIIEQLYQEFLSQDSSLVSQKPEILGLLERMRQHTPIVSIDPLFQKNLKSRLEHHLHYIHNLKTNPSEVSARINRLARLISYGLPAVAFGVIIFLALPYHPITPLDQNDIIPHIDTIENPSQIVVETALEPILPLQDKKIIPKTLPIPLSEKNNTSSASQDATQNIIQSIETTPMTMKASVLTVGGDTYMISTATEGSQSLQPTTITQQYTDGIIQLSYIIDISGGDLLLQGRLLYCNITYTLSESLVGVSNNSTIIAQIKDTSSDNVSRISVHFTDGLITKIEGLGSTCT